jgi:hypothetical protein
MAKIKTHKQFIKASKQLMDTIVEESKTANEADKRFQKEMLAILPSDYTVVNEKNVSLYEILNSEIMPYMLLSIKKKFGETKKFGRQLNKDEMAVLGAMSDHAKKRVEK